MCDARTYPNGELAIVLGRTVEARILARSRRGVSKQGRQEGELAVILRLLNRRIGTVEPEIQQRLRQLSITQLEDLAEALLDFSGATDLDNWLK